MIVGVVMWDLHINGCSSLKDKRRVVKSLKDKLHNRFNVSVAETANHDLWQRTEIACCVVSTDRQHAESVLSAAENMVSDNVHTRVIDSRRTFL